MCGIAGIISNNPVDQKLIKGMTDIIRYRGPDGEGFESFLDGRVWLGHRRLAIIDLSVAGHQPMSYKEGRYWITYNGEIYNYVELKRELEKLGHTFQSRTDTEVILAAFAEWGTGCLHKFNGMFAFILIDLRNRKVFAARDRFGIKPLYFWHSPEGFIAFGSEIKQFSGLPGWKAKLNGQRAYDFLNWSMFDHTDETLFAGVYQLRGGHAAEFSIGAEGPLPVYQWYQFKPVDFCGSLQDAAAQFRELLYDSIRLRLRSDVLVGSCLSGGLDSSSIVCIVNDLLRKEGADHKQRTFSACSENERFDERKHVAQIVNSTSVDANYTVPPAQELFETLDKLIYHQDEPFLSTSIYAQWHVFKLAAGNKVKVMLDGQGADELLAGYHGFFGRRFSSLVRRLDLHTFYSEMVQTNANHGYNYLRMILETSNALLPEMIRQPLRKAVGKASVTQDWLNIQCLGAEPVDPSCAFTAGEDGIRQFSHSTVSRTILPMLLHWEDRDSMAHSIESRVPFLDYRLAEFSLGLPDEYKISDGITKRTLRESMKGVLPEQIRMRMDKMGFATAEEYWMRELMTDDFRKYFLAGVENSAGIIRNSAIDKFDRILNGRESFSSFVWRIISFGCWIKRFNVNFN